MRAVLTACHGRMDDASARDETWQRRDDKSDRNGRKQDDSTQGRIYNEDRT